MFQRLRRILRNIELNTFLRRRLQEPCALAREPVIHGHTLLISAKAGGGEAEAEGLSMRDVFSQGRAEGGALSGSSCSSPSTGVTAGAGGQSTAGVVAADSRPRSP